MERGRQVGRFGFTLIECVSVVAIVAIIATFGVVRMAGVVERAKQTAVASDLKVLREAFLDPSTGYLRDMRGIPGFSVGYLRVSNLFLSTNVYGAVMAGGVRIVGKRVDDPTNPLSGCARPEVFNRWDEQSERGWRGPYVTHFTGCFPSREARRFADDATAVARGFYPELTGLREPEDFLVGKDGCSVYGFPGEPTMLDPWGNPYVLQIPPAQAFPGDNDELPDEARFRFARLVSAGPDGRLQAPCFGANPTNQWTTAWSERRRRLSRQAGRIDGADVSSRGDDIVLFLNREDVDEGADE